MQKPKLRSRPLLLFALFFACSLLFVGTSRNLAQVNSASPSVNHFKVYPLHETASVPQNSPYGYSPSQIKAAYTLPQNGGANTTIAIIDAYNYSNVKSELSTFSSTFGLPDANLEVYNMSARLGTNSNWTLEAALDVEWAHAIAPNAKILLVQAVSDDNFDLLSAVDYARSRADVVSISMSWGGPEDNTVTGLDYHFRSNYGAVFFASSGDTGSTGGITWPADSPYVVAVGGTTLSISNGLVTSETAWSSSGGGTSIYESRPAYQTTYGLTGTKRTIPDVSYNANPSTGFSVYSNNSWVMVGGTSAGAPQWAAIQADGGSASNTNLYEVAKSPAYTNCFRDITSGSNGAHQAGLGYDLVTGLGSPLTVNFAVTTAPPPPQTEGDYVTLVPAGQANPLNGTNEFKVTYTLNGASLSTYAQNGTLPLTIDAGTNVTVAGQSTGSTGSEKWVLNANESPVTGRNMTLYYYDLLVQQANFTIVGGGNPQNLTLAYSTAPAAASAQPNFQPANLQLNQSAQPIWSAIGTTASTNAALSANGTEQWLPQNTSWLIASANQLQSIVFYHQFLLNVTGATTSNRWYNSSDSAVLAFPEIYGRDLGIGTGQRISSYAVDGAPVQVQPTNGNITVQVIMNSAHQIQVNSTRQYMVSLDNTTTSWMASITPPTISGDNYWYDEATHVQLILNATANRTAGSGARLTSFTVNGAQTNVNTLGQLSALDIASLSSPQQVSANITQQYQLSTTSGSLQSITPPSVSGDAGWYDAGTVVTVTYSCSWNSSADQSRLNAANYAFSQGASIALNRTGTGTFVVQIAMNQPNNITIGAIKQYPIAILGGSNIVLSQPSPTNDAFFDEGTVLSATTDTVWGMINGNTRLILVGYTINGATSNITLSQTGAYTTPPLTVNQSQQLMFNAVNEYLVTFQFKNSNGEQEITPTIFQIETSNQGIVNVPQFSLWLESGNQFQVESVIWQNAEVKPADQATYIVSSPLNMTVLCRVFDAKLVVTNYLGTPVSDAQINVTLANQTQIQTTTDNNGTLSLSMIPKGTFKVSVYSNGTSTTFVVDASTKAVIPETLPTSTPAPTVLPSPQIPELPSPAIVTALCILVSTLAYIVKGRRKTAAGPASLNQASFK